MVATFVWLGIAVVFGFIEAAAPALVCLWFCLGAAVAFVVSFFVDNILAQVAVFLVASVAMLLALRPFIRKRTKANPEDALTNSDAYVGREVVVTQGIPEGAGQTGRVLLRPSGTEPKLKAYISVSAENRAQAEAAERQITADLERLING